MQPFLKLVAQHVVEHYKDNVENLCLVLPGKRPALFLKKHLFEEMQSPFWVPEIISAEEFIERLSGLKKASETDLLALLYLSYTACNPQGAESFDKFARWGHMMLADFNEIDRYLVPSEELYENLKNIKEIENWSLAGDDLSEAQKNYIAFMGKMGSVYKHFTEVLTAKRIGYQGLIYKKAVQQFKSTKVELPYYKILFCGLNALNKAEKIIYKLLQESGKAYFLWDADEYYLKIEQQEAGYFLRSNFSFFSIKNPEFISDCFRTQKKIIITSAAGQMAQAQLAAIELNKLKERNVDFSKVALVLANEKLLWPTLKMLPESVGDVNITMEYPVKHTQIYGFLEKLLDIQLNFLNPLNRSKNVYHKDFLSVLNHSFFSTYCKALNTEVNVFAISKSVREANLVYLNNIILGKELNNNSELMKLFTMWKNGYDGNLFFKQMLGYCRDQIFFDSLHAYASLEVENIQVLLASLNRLDEILNAYPFFKEPRAYRQLFIQTIGTASIPYIGEPLTGLQIMGVLETRTLDFDYVIMLGVNEGVLPSGKSINSFLPNDLKRTFGLPMYYEKDAIYAYHFYRLLQRAQEVHLVHDNQTDELGKGERSRFITQLVHELKPYELSHEVIERTAVSLAGKLVANAIQIEKTDEVMKPILEKAFTSGVYAGLSPSSLITYKDCSLKFYFRYGAGLKELKEVEENAESNTFGSILHLSLEKLYKPFLGVKLTSEYLDSALTKIEHVVNESFSIYFSKESFKTGKNLLQLEVLKEFVRKQINSDKQKILELSQEGKQLEILFLEKEWRGTFLLPGNQAKEVFIKGTIDRIDRCGDTIRILDYKNSIKQDDKFKFKGYSELFGDVQYNKQFQLMLYSWLVYKNNALPQENVFAGIIPFKDFSDEPVFLAIPGHVKKDALPLTTKILNDFEPELSQFVSGIFDQTQPFEQTNDTDICRYCDYNTICNRNIN